MIILLNGASSSGKSTIGEALKNASSIKLLHVSVDDVFRFYPHRKILEIRDDEVLFTKQLVEINTLLFRLVGLIDDMGLNVIVDVVFERPQIIKMALEELYGRDVSIVGVFCSLEALEEREKLRTNRRRGLARSQYDVVHKDLVYDLEIDTSTKDIKENVEEMERKIIREKMKSKAFIEMTGRGSTKENA